MDWDKVRRRFEAKYLPEPNSGCWLWTASVRPNGYGQLGVQYDGVQKVELAHRVSYLLKHGPRSLDDGSHVLHSCDTPCCVNPDHLRKGTHQENMQEKVEKGRVPYGENAGGAKLSAEQVMRIMNDSRPCYIIAPDYGVTDSVVAAIKSGRNWGKVTGIALHNRRNKLSDRDVEEIVSSEDPGVVLARRFGVSEAMISRIRKGSRRANVVARMQTEALDTRVNLH